MKVTIEKITPSLAKSWLEMNENFRPPKPRFIAKMAEDMKGGHWDENGESIKWSEDDKLVDGQNRLMACVQAQVPFTSVVVYGVKSDLNIDCGTMRKLADYLRHHGVDRYAEDASAGLRAINELRKTGRISAKGYARESYHNLIALFQKEAKLMDTVVRIQKQKGICLSASIAIGLVHTFRAKDEALAEKFVQVLEGSMTLSPADPAMQLREKLMKDRLSRAKVSAQHKAALAILAWNHWRKGTSTKNLNWRESGPTAMAFPVIQ